MTKLLCSLLLLAAAARADFDAKNWRFRLPVNVASGTGVAELAVTPDIFRHSLAHLTDLRIIRADGAEVPYVVRILAGQLVQKEREIALLDKAYSKGVGVQAVLDLRGHEEHNRLRLSTNQRNFKEKIVVETSDDKRHWSTVLADGVIFDIFRPDGGVSDLTVDYPTSTRRYVRVTIPDWTDAAYLESAWLAEYKESPASRRVTDALSPTVTQREAEQSTDFVFDLGYAGQPTDRLVLSAAPGFFSRAAEIACSNDGKRWSEISGAYIVRTANEEHLTTDFPETWDRYIRFTVFNADNAPVVVQSAAASGVLRIVRFPVNSAGSYWLYLGNASAREPVYDFAKIDDPKAPAVVTSLGNAEANPDFQLPQAPFSERKPWLLNLALGIAVALMAYITYRFAKKATSPAA